MGVNHVKEPRFDSLVAARQGDGCMKDTVHPVRHPRVHLPDRASVRRRIGCGRQNGSYGRGMAPSWAGGTPLFATCSWRKNRGVPPAHTFFERRVSGRGETGMLLTIQKSYELLANYGCFAREICDKCGIVLGAVRFTRYGESEVYCSRECRGGERKNATAAEYSIRNKELAEAKIASLALGYPRTCRTAQFELANGEWRPRQNSRCRRFRHGARDSA